MRIPRSKTIKEFTYTVEPLGAKVGSLIALRLGKVLAGGNPFDKLSPEDFTFVAEHFAKVTTVTGGDYGTNAPILANVYDDHFAGRYMDLGLWLKLCFDTNFESFLTDLAALLKEQGEAAAGGVLGSLTQLIGKSGESS